MSIDQAICAECIEVLASVCEMTSLATLSLYFPPQKIWQFEMLNVRMNGLEMKVFHKNPIDLNLTGTFKKNLILFKSIWNMRHDGCKTF